MVKKNYKVLCSVPIGSAMMCVKREVRGLDRNTSGYLTLDEQICTLENKEDLQISQSRLCTP